MMRRYAFLRAINTGGRRLTNPELLAPFHRIGLHDAVAYQAAGNVTFTSGEPEGELVARLEVATAESYGFASPVFVRDHGELSAVVSDRPFDEAALAGTEGRVQVTFLRSAPALETVAALERLVPDEDLVAVIGRQWFWLPVRGISESALPVGKVEGLLGPMTMRTLGTVERMVRKFA